MSVVSETAAPAAGRSFWLGVAAYIVPTFLLGYVWHLVLFAPSYQALQIYRPDLVIPLGFAAMFVQAIIFSWSYPRLFPSRRGLVVRTGLLFGAVMGLLSWSFSTLAVAAKFPMTSLAGYIALETAFTAVHFLIVGPLIALAHRN